MILAATIICIITGIIIYNYSIDQVKIKGQAFGNQIENIQDDLVRLQTEFSSAVTMFHEGDMTEQEFLEYSKQHVSDMNELINRYDDLAPPGPFESSVELFKLSAQSQLERDRHIILWLETGDESFNIRADQLHQESFSYELAALSDFKAAKLAP